MGLEQLLLTVLVSDPGVDVSVVVVPAVGAGDQDELHDLLTVGGVRVHVRTRHVAGEPDIDVHVRPIGVVAPVDAVRCRAALVEVQGADDPSLRTSAVVTGRLVAVDHGALVMRGRRRRVALVPLRLVAGEVRALVVGRRRRRVAVVPLRLVAGEVRAVVVGRRGRGSRVAHVVRRLVAGDVGALVVLHYRRRWSRDLDALDVRLSLDLRQVTDLDPSPGSNSTTRDRLRECSRLHHLPQRNAQRHLGAEVPGGARRHDLAEQLDLDRTRTERLWVTGWGPLFELLGVGLAGLDLLGLADEASVGGQHVFHVTADGGRVGLVGHLHVQGLVGVGCRAGTDRGRVAGLRRAGEPEETGEDRCHAHHEDELGDGSLDLAVHGDPFLSGVGSVRLSHLRALRIESTLTRL